MVFNGYIGRFLFWFLAFLLVFLSFRSVFFGVEIGNPEMIYHLKERATVMYVHIAAAAISLFIIPFQFWTGLRNTAPGVHKIMGRLCGLAIIVGGITGFFVGIGTYERYGLFGAIGFMVGSVIWTIAGIIGIWFAIQRNLVAHRTWMIISAALIFGAVTIRFEISIYRHTLGVSYDQATALGSWTCWMFNIMALAFWHRAALREGRVRFA